MVFFSRAASYAAVLLGLTGIWTTGAAAQSCTARTLIIAAHQDDDIIFFNPAETTDIKEKRCVRIVYVTAGDAGGTSAYWGNRELATQRGHETMARVAAGPDNILSINVRGHRLARRRLANAPRVDIVFLRLPDGNIPGDGFQRNNFDSLFKLGGSGPSMDFSRKDSGAQAFRRSPNWRASEVPPSAGSMSETARSLDDGAMNLPKG